jgi:hypothetical protein
MPDCDRCGASFDGEDAYLGHLASEHPDDLGPIEQRRVADRDDGEFPTGPVVIGGIFLVVAAVVEDTVLVAGGGGSGGEPYGVGERHYHGTIEVVIDGERIDFSRSRYQLRDDAFHFEGGVGERWHVHARGVTLAYALSTLGIEVSETAVTFEGTTYRASDPDTTVEVTVNGESVTPSEYVLRPEDEVRVVARRG